MPEKKCKTEVSLRKRIAALEKSYAQLMEVVGNSLLMTWFEEEHDMLPISARLDRLEKLVGAEEDKDEEADDDEDLDLGEEEDDVPDEGWVIAQNVPKGLKLHCSKERLLYYTELDSEDVEDLWTDNLREAKRYQTQPQAQRTAKGITLNERRFKSQVPHLICLHAKD